MKMNFYDNIDLFREAKEQQSGDKEAYEKFFQATLKKFGADSPQDLEKEKRKEFFDYINKNWKAQDESNVTEKMSRQLKDPKTEVMVVKNNKVKVIDKKDQDKYMKQGYELAESVVTEETVYIEYLNKDKGFRKDRKDFKGKNAYDDAVKWAEKNLGKVTSDMIKFESKVNEALEVEDEMNELGPMTGKMPDADAENKDGQTKRDKTFKRWHDAATEVRDHPYGENQDGAEFVEPAAQPQAFAIEQIVNKYLKDQD